MSKYMGMIATALTASLLMTSCGVGGGNDAATGTPVPTADPELTKNTISATIEVEKKGSIELELYPDLAPETVKNFVSLAEDGFYDGTIFHRVIDDFMIQGGGYDKNLKEQKADTIFGEFKSNGFENTLSHLRGVISMARAQDVNSASSQFFIVQKDATYLDGQYAAFGKVTEGMDVVDEIAAERTGTVASQGMEDVPVDPVVIKSITINNGNASSKSKSTAKPSGTTKPSSDDNDITDKLPFVTGDDDDAIATSKPSSKPSSSNSSGSSSSSGSSNSKSSSGSTGSSSSRNSNSSSSSEDEEIARFFQGGNGGL